MLAAGKVVRGTFADPFGYLQVRREERELIAWYGSLLDEVLPRLDDKTLGGLLELLSLPQGIRGYEQVKSKSAIEAKDKARRLLAALGKRPTSRVIPMKLAA